MGSIDRVAVGKPVGNRVFTRQTLRELSIFHDLLFFGNYFLTAIICFLIYFWLQKYTRKLLQLHLLYYNCKRYISSEIRKKYASFVNVIIRSHSFVVFLFSYLITASFVSLAIGL